MLRYLHLQSQPAMRGFARQMLQGGDYAFHPNQQLPDLPDPQGPPAGHLVPLH